LAKNAGIGRANKNMSPENRAMHSARMTAHNPSKLPGMPAKISAARKGKPFAQRGGNGKPTEPQLALSKALDLPIEMGVSTREVAHIFESIPIYYKVDVGHWETKLAIEVDGKGHRTVIGQQRDQKKTEVLCALGWTVLRFSNKQVTEHLGECVQTVLSTISKLKARTTTLPTVSSSTIATNTEPTAAPRSAQSTDSVKRSLSNYP
jgi:hypothetical protein